LGYQIDEKCKSLDFDGWDIKQEVQLLDRECAAGIFFFQPQPINKMDPKKWRA
jgi:hypothetical protein